MKKIEEMSIEEILNYSVPYDDEYTIPLFSFDKLSRNKNKKDKLYNKAINIQKCYLDDFGSLLPSAIRSKMYNGKRVISFDSRYFILSTLRVFGIKIDKDYIDKDLILYAKNEIRNLRSKLNKVSNMEELKNINRGLHDTIMSSKRSKFAINNCERIIEDYRTVLSKILCNLEGLCKELEKPLDESLFSEIDKEKLLFAHTCLALDSCTSREEVYNSIYTVIKYLRENNKNNNVEIYYCKNDNYKELCAEKFNYGRLTKICEEYLKLHKEIEDKPLDENEYKDKSKEKLEKYLENKRDNYLKFKKEQEELKKEAFNKKLEEQKKLEERQKELEKIKSELTLNWELCPSGTLETEKSVHVYTPKIKRGEYDRSKFQKIYDEKVDFFSKSDYVIHIFGKEKFEGYEGYIYPNGIVLFEMLTKKGNIAKNTALYVMDIRNFIEFSKMNKQQIMEIIKDNEENNLKRINHSKNWQVRALNVINKETDITLEELRNVKLYQKRI